MAVVASSACTSAVTPETPSDTPRRRVVHVAQPCPELERVEGRINPAEVRAFVEITQVAERELPSPLAHWLAEHPVEAESTAHVIAFPGVPTSTPWGLCVDAVCSSSQRSLTLVAHLPDDAADPVELSLTIEDRATTEPPDAKTAPTTLLAMTIHATDREPVMVATPSELGGGSLLVTAYLLRRFDDLHRVLTCKADPQAEAETARE